MHALALLSLGLAPGGAQALSVGPHAISPNAVGFIEFDKYAQLHDRTYEPNSEEYNQRKKLFEQRAAEVVAQNSQPDRMWTATINHLSDRTEEELDVLRGYNRHVTVTKSAHRGTQLLSQAVFTRSLDNLPSDFSWNSLTAASKIMDQQDCGSCWALSASSVISAHSEIYRNEDRSCSVEQLISCTPNPANCGGSGGCGGATTELAMEYILQNGCQNSSQWPYKGREQTCPQSLTAKRSESGPRTEVWSRLGTILGGGARRSADAGLGSASFGMLGYRKLPENLLAPLLLAVYEQGPVAVTVAAGSAWNMYHSGVMNSCRKEAIISHAVMLLGFGESMGRRNKANRYWLLQNSWGRRWGEKGTIRLYRHGHEEEEQWCGWDRNPGAGSGCSGGPPRVWICGSCGILYDNVVPIFRQPDPSAVRRARGLQNGTALQHRTEVR